MRRLCTFAVVVGSLLTAAVPAHASGSTNSHSSSRGSGASASFSTLPSGGAVPNTVYTDTYVGAAHDLTTADGTRDRDDAVYVDRFSYAYDGSGTFVPVSYAYGFAHGSSVTLSASNSLSSASVTATVPLTVCAIDADWSSTCAGSVDTPIGVAWTGQGTTSRGHSVSNWSTGGSRYVSRYNGTFRDASASGTLGGDELGSSRWGQLYDVNAMSLSICHEC